MRTETTTRTLYQFSELSEAAKQHALGKQAEFEGQEFDPEFVYYDAANIAALMGIDLNKRAVKLMGGGTRYEPAIYYSGFWSQGDGACFEGTYQYKKGSQKAVREYAPVDAKLHRIVDGLFSIQARNFYQLQATSQQRGHYYHSGCMDVSVERYDGKEMTDDAEDEITQLLRDFADWIYKQLEAEYDYRVSAEACQESIEYEYEFDENGDIA